VKEIGPKVEQRTALFKAAMPREGEVVHAWCRDPSRDERVRAAEDGRTGPLPTLKECIYGMFPKSGSATSPVEHENKGDGMATDGLRTERITLEVRHGESFGVSHWSWVTILRLQSGESVRVVEDPAQAASGGGEQPRGWLTGEEREAVQWAADAAYDKQHPAEDTLRNILARSTPPGPEGDG